MPPHKPLPKRSSNSKDTIPDVSFIGMVDFSDKARWIYMTESVKDLLGFDTGDLLNQPSMDLVHPDEVPRLKKLHLDTINGDKAAAVVYIRMRHKNPGRGYILCGVSRTICHNVVVGSVAYATAPKGFKLASTAQEITVLAPQGKHLVSKWNDPQIMPVDPIPDGGPSYGIQPSKSFRTAFFLDRFSLHCYIQYCSNKLLITKDNITKRPFFDFVAPEDEEQVRKSFENVKSEGITEEGKPATGGFDYGRFTLLVNGRDYLKTLAKKEDGTGRVSKSKVPARTASNPIASSRSRVTSLSGSSSEESAKVPVDYIFSAHSDGLLVILRRTPKASASVV